MKGFTSVILIFVGVGFFVWLSGFSGPELLERVEIAYGAMGRGAVMAAFLIPLLVLGPLFVKAETDKARMVILGCLLSFQGGVLAVGTYALPPVIDEVSATTVKLIEGAKNQ